MDMLDRDRVRAAPGRSLTDARPGDARTASREGIGELLQAFTGVPPASGSFLPIIDGETEAVTKE
jgi:hypothetical protein